MFLDRDETRVIAPAGWGDDYAWLWSYDIATGHEERVIQFPHGMHLSPATDGIHFLVKERITAEAHWFSIRTIASPDVSLATALHDGRAWTFEGDTDLWSRVRRWHTVWLRDRTHLLHVEAADVDPHPLDWYYEGAYDFGYQGILDPIEIPNSHLILMPIQRDSRPAVYDPDARCVVAYLELAERGGNPHGHFLRTGHELWIDDYDTLLRLETGTWRKLGASQLQPAPGRRTQEFIGDFWFPFDERMCVVARPFSGDVLALDPSTMKVVAAATTGKQPLEAVVLKDGSVIARDWQSRDVLHSTLKRRRFPLRR